MRYLALALFAEGPSDHAFLQRIIFRSVHEIASRLSDAPVEIPEAFVRGLDRSGGPRAETVAATFGAAIVQGAVTLLFIHADGDRDARAALRDRVQPCCEILSERYGAAPFGCVAVVPVRETEAWALADPQALRDELGTNLRADELELPNGPREVEECVDPKVRLGRAIALARPRRRGYAGTGLLIPAGLGDRIRLNRLRTLTAFQEFEVRVEDAIATLWRP